MAEPVSETPAAGGVAVGRRRAVYATVIFLGAFLLFVVQPILAKVILPWFGGAAGVWATAMLFFQGALLVGYVYAYWTVRRLRPGWQALLHLALLGVSVYLLPVAPAERWKPTGNEDATFRVLGLLAASAGLPYLLLSSTGPLMQAWYAHSERVAFPYRLFALSNLACLLALVAYPVAIEPLIGTRTQLLAWSGGYVVFCALSVAAAAQYWARRRVGPAEEEWNAPPGTPAPDGRTQLLWIALPACASTLLLAVTNHLCQNVAAIPLLWVAPLALYLMSFILCFDRAGWYRPAWFRWLLPVTLVGMVFGLLRESTPLPPKVWIALFAAGLFICSMFCHGELAALKPHARHLTSYYLRIALGGALGGLFVGLAAPVLLSSQLELQIGIAACAVLALLCLYGYSWRRLVAVSGLALLAFVASVRLRVWTEGIRVTVRNFYGALTVTESGSEPEHRVRRLLHGQTVHGSQFVAAARSRQATTYYGPRSGAGLALERGAGLNRRVGVIGLGVGTLARYGRPGDYIRFYELNPLVIELARSEFRFLTESQAQVEVVPGDARLALEREPSQQFDVLVIDAFSGDAIPTHLLTREAFALYFCHLKPDGLVAAHISSRYANLSPQLRKQAGAFGQEVLAVDSEADPRGDLLGATWVLMARSLDDFRDVGLPAPPGQTQAEPGPALWTDDYVNLLAVLR